MTTIKSGATRADVCEYAEKEYGTLPEYLWQPLPGYCILRRADNKKWYAGIMDVPKNKLGLCGEERVDVLVVRCDPFMRDMLLTRDGFLPAYHLNRENWISVLLDGTVESETVYALLDGSYNIAKVKAINRRRAKRHL